MIGSSSPSVCTEIDMQRGPAWLRATRFFLFTSFISSLCVASSASAWVGLGVTWPNNRVSYVIYGRSALELGAQRVQGIIAEAYDSWTSPECSAFRADALGRTDEDYDPQDGLITHQWFYDANQRPEALADSSLIGVTLISTVNNQLFDGDILYNGIDHRWVEGETAPGEVDALSIITHEIGHQLGLGHSGAVEATMYLGYLGGTEPRSLEPDDLQGLCTLYPSGSPLSCGPFPPCRAGERCVEERCEVIPEPPIGGDCPCDEGGECVLMPDGERFCTRRCENGRCPEGWRCERVEGDAGSSLLPLCLPFEPPPERQPRAFGAECDGSIDCESGLCVTDILGQQRCSAYCRSFEDCPEQERCVPISDGGNACLPGTRSRDAPRPTVVPAPSPTPPGEGMNNAPCDEDADCVGLLCLFDEERGFCSELCSEDADCPEPHICLPIGGGESGCWFPEYIPPEPAPDGSPCGEASECVSGFCNQAEARCRTRCRGDEECPMDERCVEAGAEQICRPSPPPPLDLAPPQSSPPDRGPPAGPAETIESGGCSRGLASTQLSFARVLLLLSLLACLSGWRRRARSR